MIIISAGAGLGNQMYEYAFYLRMKKQYPKTKVYLDPDYAFVYAHNGFEVESIFGLKSERAKREDVYRIGDGSFLANTKEYKSFGAKIKRKMGIHKKSFIIQKDFTEFYPEVLRLNPIKDWYLYGPFANSRYFDSIKDEVCDIYTFPAIDKNNRNTIEKIQKTYSVSLHIRRGDYLKEGVVTLGIDYYKKAIDIIAQKCGKKEEEMDFFVFSDDLEYVNKLFGTKENYHIISENKGKNSFRDMQLMSKCQHNITANSTFSFWGAYLNKNKDAIVVSPKEPFKGCLHPFACEEWIKI